MDNIQVTLPDGSVKSVPAGTAPLDVARSISPRLADDAIVARVDGNLWDLNRPFEGNAQLQILTTKNPEALEVYRHSTAHLLAAAVLELFPETKLGIGPPIDTGFYYDFQRDAAFTPEDLEKIEKKMWEIQARDLPYERKYTEKNEGLKLYADQPMKVELITERAGDVFSEYTLGPQFIDFCRGPHVPSTKKIKAFKLLSIAGAYWKGNEKNAQLQRIYGTAFFNKKDLDEYLAKLEEAKKRDHRKLGQELDLFSIQELAGPGLIFFHPKGGIIRKLIEDWMRDQYLKRGYSLVYTPHVMRADLWRTSGHLSHYAENMFAGMELDDAEYRLKPMNCPGHILIYRDKLRSYRELPVRLGELGTVYRYERSGTMHGLLRVRGFTQDDAHIFCTRDQIEDEVVNCLEFALDVLKAFGFEQYDAEISTWDGGASGKYDGEPDQWALAEGALKRAVERLNIKAPVIPDEAAFYGPKIDVKLLDASGPQVAAFHRAVRFHAAAPVQSRIRRRRRQAASAADGASRAVRQHRAVLRHADRALRRRVPGMARAGAGGGDADHRPAAGLREDGSRETRSRRVALASGRSQGKGQPQNSRRPDAEGAVHAGGGRSRSRGGHGLACGIASTPIWA